MGPELAALRDNRAKPDTVTGNQEAIVGVLWPATNSRPESRPEPDFPYYCPLIVRG